MNQQQPKRRKRRQPQPQVKTSSQRVRGGRRQGRQSKQSLVDKMGFRPGHMLCLVNPPQGAYVRFSNELPKRNPLYLGLPPRGLARHFVFWPDGAQSLGYALSYLKSMLDPEGAIWVIMPKKKPAQESESTIALPDLRQAAEKLGLVNDKQISYSGSHHAVRLGSAGSGNRGRSRR